MRPVAVVVVGVDAKHGFEMSPGEREHPVQALAAQRARDRSAIAFVWSARIGVRITSIPLV
jgi:hypothetical protein